MDYRILSLDGGGIRAVIQAEIICCIEADFNDSVYNLFDFFAGTSSGGLLSLYVASCRADGNQCLEFFASDAAGARRPRVGMPGAATAGVCLMSRGCQALGRWGQLRLGADLGMLGAFFRSKPGGLRCRSRP